MERYSSSSGSDPESPSNLQETFVDDRTRVVGTANFLNQSSNLNRSASSVTSKTRAPIAKPVRRSKSQHFHGGESFLNSHFVKGKTYLSQK